MFVGDHVTPALWLLDANGNSMKRLGRRGGGPAEYRTANRIAVDGDDRLIMWDDGNGRLNVYETDGSFRASARLPIHYGGCCDADAVTVDSLNRIWLRASAPARDRSGRSTDLEIPVFVRFDAAGALIDSSFAPPLPGGDPPMTTVRQPEAGVTVVQVADIPYGTKTTYTVSPFGDLVFGQGRPYVVHAEAQGKPLRIEREYVPVPVSDDERAQRRARIEFLVRRRTPSWRWTGPDVHRAKEKRRDVFEADGRYLGRVVAPRTFTAFAMRGNNVWGVLRDEYDMPTIVKMRIDPGW